jgi:hypothetical protein
MYDEQSVAAVIAIGVDAKELEALNLLQLDSYALIHMHCPYQIHLINSIKSNDIA